MRWLAYGIFASFAFAQSDVDAELAKASKSPYDLAKFIESGQEFRFVNLWRAIGTSDDGQVRECSEESGRYPQCHAMVIPAGDQAIVWISLNMFDHYLRFRSEGGQWKFAGKIDDFQKYYKPHQSVLSIGGKPFFLVTSQGDSGSGVASQIEDWYDLSLEKFEPVLRVPKQYSFAPPLSVYCQAEAQVVGTTSGPPESIRIRYVAKFQTEYGPPGELGSRQQEVIYTRVRDRFVVDEKRSPTSQEELDRLYGFNEDSPSREDYLRWLKPALTRIAAGRKSDQKEWLADYLIQCENTPEKRELLRLMKPR